MEETGEMPEPLEFDEKLVMETHLETLKTQVLLQLTIYSKVKFS